jgi:hypothetical protein
LKKLSKKSHHYRNPIGTPGTGEKTQDHGSLKDGTVTIATLLPEKP